MREDRHGPTETLALNTRLEADFIQPLTGLRGALEILRDFPDLDAADRESFLDNAITECRRLEESVVSLSEAVYAAARVPMADDGTVLDNPDSFESHVHFLQDIEVLELDFSDIVFNSSRVVDECFDCIERMIVTTQRRWYVLINQSGCRVWPEAWVAFAHRLKKLNLTYSLGTVRYDIQEMDISNDVTARSDNDLFPSRQAALDSLSQQCSNA